MGTCGYRILNGLVVVGANATISIIFPQSLLNYGGGYVYDGNGVFDLSCVLVDILDVDGSGSTGTLGYNMRIRLVVAGTTTPIARILSTYLLNCTDIDGYGNNDIFDKSCVLVYIWEVGSGVNTGTCEY